MHTAGMELLISTTAAIILVIISAQICGSLAIKIGQPAVVGEMIAGILLGPTAFGHFTPGFSSYIFTSDTKLVLYVMSMIGLGLYMFLVGAEHENSKTKGERALPFVLGIVGFMFPVIFGALAGGSVALNLKPVEISFEVYLLFIGIALSVTAFPMLARVLQARAMTKTLFGAAAIKTAAIDDALAWCALAVVGAMAASGTANKAFFGTILPAGLLALILFTVAPVIFKKHMEKSVRKGNISDQLLSSLLTITLISGLISDYIGIYSVFGGFIAGITLPRVQGFAKLLNDRLLQILRCFFLPIFFAYSGMNTDIWQTFNLQTLWLLPVLLIAAILSKGIAAVIVLRFYKWSWEETISMAALMNARGLMILICVNIGLSMGIINTQIFSVMVLVAIITTALAIPVYNRYFTPEREEAARKKWDQLDLLEKNEHSVDINTLPLEKGPQAAQHQKS